MANVTTFKEPAAEAKPLDNFPAMLEAWKGQVAMALPIHMRKNIERYTRIALTAFRLNPKLAECDPRSVYAAVIQSAQLGLEIGLRGRGYLVPYKGEAQFIPGWQGLVELVYRSGVAMVWTGAVYEGDVFDYQLGDAPFVRHKPKGEDDPSLLRFTYCCARVKGGEFPLVEVWPVAKIWRHRDRYNKVGNRHYSFENEEMYARKVPLLQVVKYLPQSVELQRALTLDDLNELAQPQGLTIEGAAEQDTSAAVVAAATETKNDGKVSVEEIFALADDAVKSKDWDTARDLARGLPEEKAKLILDRCPPVRK